MRIQTILSFFWDRIEPVVSIRASEPKVSSAGSKASSLALRGLSPFLFLFFSSCDMLFLEGPRLVHINDNKLDVVEFIFDETTLCAEDVGLLPSLNGDPISFTYKAKSDRRRKVEVYFPATWGIVDYEPSGEEAVYTPYGPLDEFDGQQLLTFQLVEKTKRKNKEPDVMVYQIQPCWTGGF